MGVKDVKDLPKNTGQAVNSIKSIFKGLIAAYVIAVPVHDIATGESLLSKTWNSTVVAAMDGTDMCKKNDTMKDSFVCEPRGDGKGLGSLIPNSLK